MSEPAGQSNAGRDRSQELPWLQCQTDDGHPFPEPKPLRRWRAGKSSELHRSGSFVPIRQAGTIPDHEPDVLTIAGFGDCKSNIPASTGRFQESADGVLLHQQADVREDGGILKKYQLWNRKIYFVFIYWVYAILKVLDYWNPFGVAGLTGWLVSAVQAPESGP